MNKNNPNAYGTGSDSDRIEQALAYAKANSLPLEITARESADGRTHWLIDRAVCLPGDTEMQIVNCKIKLSDRCRDNFIRSANCGIGIDPILPVSGIRVKGIGQAVLEGADHPRATGDGSKILACPCPYDPEDLISIAPWVPEDHRTLETLAFWDRHNHSYGTDAGDLTESQYGDWRGVGVLFANVENFSVENITVVKSHGWGLSFEACSHGTIRNITFDACMYKEIDGMRQNMENQDGINLRNGCHHILISDVFGQTGDDVVALTAHRGYDSLPGGSLRTTHVMHTDYTRREPDIHDVIIRNVIAQSHLCYLVRLLPGGTDIWNVVIDGVVDTSTEQGRNFGAFVFGTKGTYGSSHPGELRGITVNNVISTGKKVFDVQGYWSDSTVSNIINKNPDAPMFLCYREGGMTQVHTTNLHTVEKA